MFSWLRRFGFFLVILIFCPPAVAQKEESEIESVTILADSRLAVSLSDLASAFSPKNMISISTVFGESAEQKIQIENGESADLFITSNPYFIQQLRIKGLVDVHTIGEIASTGGVHYVAAVVAGENMTPARQFLAFLHSPHTAEIWKRNGFSVPEPDEP